MSSLGFVLEWSPVARFLLVAILGYVGPSPTWFPSAWHIGLDLRGSRILHCEVPRRSTIQ